MAHLPVRDHPATFYLTALGGFRAGPFSLTDNTRMELASTTYTLKVQRDTPALPFTLHPANGSPTLGPFTPTDGTEITLNNQLYTVRRPLVQISITISHPNRIAQSPTVAMAPLTHHTMQQLAELRQKYAALVERVKYETADMHFQGVPTVTMRHTGTTRSPVVSVSQRDKQNSTRTAELSAIRYLETLLRSTFTLRSRSITDKLTYHFLPPAPGHYILCATQRIKPPNSPPATPYTTTIWWTPLEYDSNHPLTLDLNADNAISWHELFNLTPPAAP